MGEPFKLFPIQLRQVGVPELHIVTSSFGSAGAKFSDDFELSVGVGPYMTDQRTIQVFVTAVSSQKEIDSPNNFRVTVAGEFHIEDENALNFPLNLLPAWAEKNGSAVLLPFLREVVFNSTSKSGFLPVLMPLIEVPQFKVMPPQAVFSRPYEIGVSVPSIK